MAALADGTPSTPPPGTKPAAGAETKGGSPKGQADTAKSGSAAKPAAGAPGSRSRATAANRPAGAAEAIGGLDGAIVPLLCTEANARIALRSELVSFNCVEGSPQSGYDACDIRIRYDLTSDCRPTRTINKSVACQVDLVLDQASGTKTTRSFSAAQLASLDASAKSGTVDIAAGPFGAPDTVVQVGLRAGACRLQ